jgi:PKD repeat protein
MLERNRSCRWAIIGWALVLVVCILGGTGLAPGTLHGSVGAGNLHSSVHPSQTVCPSSASLQCTGVDPSAISVTWSAYTGSCFQNYTVDDAPSADGPWVPIWSTTAAAANTAVLYSLTPSTTYYYQVWTFWQNYFLVCYGSNSGSSSVLQATQPSEPMLTVSQPTETSATLTWSNPASYGGGLGFGSYSVMEAINNVASVSVDSITSLSDTGYTASALSPSTDYSFYVVTTDTGFGTDFTGSTTNNVAITTPAPIVATTTANPTSVNAGSSVNLDCSATGGVEPYTYSWSFGDGQTGSGSPVTHTYSTAGTYTATCTVTDAHGLVATSTVTVTVNTNPTVAGLPASQGYGLVTGLVVLAVVLVAVVAIVLLLRRKSQRPPQQSSTPSAPSGPASPPSAP